MWRNQINPLKLSGFYFVWKVQLFPYWAGTESSPADHLAPSLSWRLAAAFLEDTGPGAPGGLSR